MCMYIHSHGMNIPFMSHVIEASLATPVGRVILNAVSSHNYSILYLVIIIKL